MTCKNSNNLGFINIKDAIKLPLFDITEFLLEDLTRFYKNFYQYALIEKKRKAMEKTMEYSQLIYRQ